MALPCMRVCAPQVEQTHGVAGVSRVHMPHRMEARMPRAGYGYRLKVQVDSARWHLIATCRRLMATSGRLTDSKECAWAFAVLCCAVSRCMAFPYSTPGPFFRLARAPGTAGGFPVGGLQGCRCTWVLGSGACSL